MKIVLIKRTPFSTPDGISHFLFSLADELIARGHEVAGLTTKDAALGEVANRFAYPRLPAITALTQEEGGGVGFEIKTWWKRGTAAVAALKPDLIMVNGAVPCRYHAPSITIAHDADRRLIHGSSFFRQIYKATTYRITDRLVTTCSELVPRVARDAFFSASRIAVIPTCITPGQYHPRPLAERTWTIVHVGMQGYKNPMATIRAFLAVADRATLAIVGKVDPAVADYVKTLPPEQRGKIVLPGIVSDAEMKRYLETSRIISVPSQYDAPVASPTVLEAFAGMTPVVVSSCISRDLVEPSRNGFVADTDEERVKAFAALLDDDVLWQRISDGCGGAMSRFSASSVADRYLSLLPGAKRN